MEGGGCSGEVAKAQGSGGGRRARAGRKAALRWCRRGHGAAGTMAEEADEWMVGFLGDKARRNVFFFFEFFFLRQFFL